MPKPHPREFRDDVIAVARKGEAPNGQIAKDFGISEIWAMVRHDGHLVSPSTVVRIMADEDLL